MGCFFCAVCLGLLAAQVLTQGNGLPNPTAHPATTTEVGFFRRVFNAARNMVSPVRQDAATSMNTTTPVSPAASPRAHVLYVQKPQLNGLAQLNFSLRVLNDDFSVAEEPYTYEEGEPVYIEASVQTSSGMLFPRIFIDKCYGTDTREEIHPRRLYVIADNHGCLYSEDSETAWFRKTDSAIVLTVPAFWVTGESDEEIYIHCLLTAWSQNVPTSSSKKVCSFNEDSSSWKNMDEPSKTSVCDCCDSFCPMEFPHLGKFKASFVGEGRLHREVVGPLRLRIISLQWIWLAGRCHTFRSLMLGTTAFLGVFLLTVFFIAIVVAVVICVIRFSRYSNNRHQLLVNKMEQDSDTELKTVAGALVAGALKAAEGTEESNLDD